MNMTLFSERNYSKNCSNDHQGKRFFHNKQQTAHKRKS